MYLVDNFNYLNVKFTNYYNYSLYKVLIKKVYQISKYNFSNLYIKLKLDDFIIISNICSRLEFNKIFYNFENLLVNNATGIKYIDYQNILVIKNIHNNQYIIFGLILKKHKENENMFNMFNMFNSTYQKSIYKDLKYLIFFDKIDTSVISKLLPYLYDLSISIISNSEVDSIFPIYTMIPDTEYLKKVFKLLKLNKKKILDFDLIVINRDKFFDCIFSENILSSLNQYYISGFNEKKDIFQNKSDKYLINKLISKYPNNQFNLETIYHDYEFIIISSQFLYNIIDDLIDKNMPQLNITFNFYKYLY